jgi:hypothetical protein
MSSDNTAIGYLAIGNNSDGEGNTAIGNAALNSWEHGSYNTAIGFYADLGSDGLTNATAIGYGATVGASNSIQLGNGTVTNVKTSGSLTAGAVTYPNVDGTVAGQVLTTNAAGVASWATPSTSIVEGSIVNVDISATAAIDQSKINGLADALALKADLDSPSLTGTPTAPTADAGTNTTQIATTAFVAAATAAISNVVDLTSAQTIDGIKTFNSDVIIKGITTGRGNGDIETNTAFGMQSLSFNTGIENTATGYRALWRNTSGSKNTASGNNSLRQNTTGSENTATGHQSLQSNTTGQGNTATGSFALSSNREGSNSTAVGNSALYYNMSSDNTAIGYLAIGNNSDGEGNTAIGNLALGSLDHGSYNTAIGNGADLAFDGLTNATAIGYGATVGASNTIQLGNGTVTNVKTSGSLTAGAVTYPNVDGTVAGQVLTTDAAGVASWATPSASIVAGSIVNVDISATAAIDQSKINGLTADLAAKAPLASPTFTGTPTLPTGTIGVTQTAGNNSTALATTEYVDTAIGSVPAGGLVSVTENSQTGYRRADAIAANYGNIGNGAVDLSFSTSASTTHGATNRYSFTTGQSTIASGKESTAMGGLTTASGDNSTAFGLFTRASGVASTAMGDQSKAMGLNSTAMGNGTIASGTNSIAMGFVTTASDYGSLVIGQYNSAGSTATSATAFSSTAPAFVIGNGADDNNRKDAFVVDFSGNVTAEGTVTASAYVGDGSGLTGITSSNSSVAIATADYMVLTTDNYVIFTGSATGTITLPTAVGVSGKEFTIKNMTAYGVTIASTGNEEIWQDVNNKTPTVSLGVEAQNNWIKLVSDGTQWISFRGLY